MNRNATNPEILLYATDMGEESALKGVLQRLIELGIDAEITFDLNRESKVGYYVCNPNNLFDFSTGTYNFPRNQVSVIGIHDLYQDNGSGAAFLRDNTFSLFDYGFVPGDRWTRILGTSLAVDGNRFFPKIGVIEVGWPKSDLFFKLPTQASRFASSRPTALVAPSWVSRKCVMDVVDSRIGSTWDVVFKFPEFGKSVGEDNPWHEVLNSQMDEAKRAAELARSIPGMRVASDDAEIFKLISQCDVVISNGSNVSLEALIAGKPSLNVVEWTHPVGARGEGSSSSPLNLPGILSCSREFINESMDVLLSKEFARACIVSSNSLASLDSRGKSSEIVASLLVRLSLGQELKTIDITAVPIPPVSLVQIAQSKINENEVLKADQLIQDNQRRLAEADQMICQLEKDLKQAHERIRLSRLVFVFVSLVGVSSLVALLTNIQIF